MVVDTKAKSSGDVPPSRRCLPTSALIFLKADWQTSFTTSFSAQQEQSYDPDDAMIMFFFCCLFLFLCCSFYPISALATGQRWVNVA